MPDFTGGQFPSLDGDVHGEVAQRSADGSHESWFKKVFSVLNRSHTLGLSVDHVTHQANAAATLQDALQRGMHPKGPVELVGEESHPSDPATTNVTYAVPVVPAVIDHENHTTVTPSVAAAVAAVPVEVEPVEESTEVESAGETHPVEVEPSDADTAE